MNLNHPQIKPGKLTEYDCTPKDGITPRDWLEIGHAVVGWVCAIGICFAVGFLFGVNLR